MSAAPACGRAVSRYLRARFVEGKRRRHRAGAWNSRRAARTVVPLRIVVVMLRGGVMCSERLSSPIDGLWLTGSSSRRPSAERRSAVVVVVVVADFLES